MRKQEQKGKITALYERLSHDDGRSDESVSVENQLCQRVHFFFEKSCVWRIHERDMEVQ